ncbi:MAG: LysM peptidoglycan-binding domain-containing protein [Rikenellaceae bacterium]|nr:LysM peptidoglycan-binding domain-containing protein [Rikenellaceae bacterium]
MRKFFLIFVFTLCCLGGYSQGINVRSDNKVIVGGEHFYVHNVQKGETLFSLSRTYGIDRDEITKYNPTVVEGLIEGSVIKIPVSDDTIENDQKNILGRINNRRVTRHVVNKGETAYSISKRYAVNIDDLITANPGFDPMNIKVGQEVLIPKSIIGSVTQSEVKDNFEQYTGSLSEVLPGFEIYLVEEKETLYSISREKGINIDTLRFYNQELLKDGLKFGSLLKIPVYGDSTTVMSTAMYLERNAADTDRSPVLFPNYNRDNNVKNNFQSEGRIVSGAVNVAVLLPFTSGGDNFVDFYNGMLLALKELKTEGVSVNLNVYDTKRSVEEVQRIFNSDALRRSDLIIGPVYENTFVPAARFAEEQRIPIVSPLGAFEGGNQYVYQIAPSVAGKYDKMKNLFSSENNIILINGDSGADQRMLSELRDVLPAGYTSIEYAKGKAASAYSGTLSLDKKNVIVLNSDNENAVEEILTKLSSIQNSISSRSGRYYDITVIGNNRWTRFANLDKQLFFKLNVAYITTYHSDRNDSRIREFDGKYLSEFGKFPTQYSYRGYDITKLFTVAMKSYGRNYADYLRRTERKILQVPYAFKQEPSGKWINNQWVLVKYNTDFTVEVF